MTRVKHRRQVAWIGLVWLGCGGGDGNERADAAASVIDATPPDATPVECPELLGDDDECNPVTQCCADGLGCYLSLADGSATCESVAPGAEELTQGDTCVHGDTDLCFRNGCAEGYGAFLYAGIGMPRDCTAFCSPADTYLVDPDGDGEGTVVATADPDGPAPHDCAEGTIGVPGHQCRFFQSYFIDSNSMLLEYIPAEYGLCTPTTAEFGDCTRYSPEWFLESYSDFIEGGGTAEQWPDEMTALCGAREGGCPFGCVAVATKEALEAAYCALPDNAARPACVDAGRVRD